MEHSHRTCGFAPMMSHVLLRITVQAGPQMSREANSVQASTVHTGKVFSSLEMTVQPVYQGNYITYSGFPSRGLCLLISLCLAMDWPLAEMFGRPDVLSHPNIPDLQCYREEGPKLGVVWVLSRRFIQMYRYTYRNKIFQDKKPNKTTHKQKTQTKKPSNPKNPYSFFLHWFTFIAE